MDVRTDIDTKEVREALRKLRSRSMKIPYRRMMVIGHRSVLRNFHQGGRPQKWAALMRPRRNETSKGKVLQDTTRMKGSIQPALVGRDGFMVYTRLKSKSGYLYPAAHQYGAPKANIVPRPFMLWQRSDILKIQMVLRDHLVKGL
jgi:phage gpG-like protein